MVSTDCSHLAAQQGHIGVVEVLLDRGANIDATTGHNETALYLATREGHIDVVKALLDRGTAVYTTAEMKWTALHEAAEQGHIKVVKVPVLLDRDAAIDAMTDIDGWTALHLAANRGHIEVIKVLLDKGAVSEVMSNHKTVALHCTAHRGPY